MSTCDFGNSRWKTQTSRENSVTQGTLVFGDTTKTLLRLNVKFTVNSWQMRMDSNQMSNQWIVSKYVIVPTCDRYHAKICYPHMLSWKKFHSLRQDIIVLRGTMMSCPQQILLRYSEMVFFFLLSLPMLIS